MDSIIKQIEEVKKLLLENESFSSIRHSLKNEYFVQNYFDIFFFRILEDNLHALEKIKNQISLKSKSRINYNELVEFYTLTTLNVEKSLNIELMKVMIILHAHYTIISWSKPNEVKISSYDDYINRTSLKTSANWYRGHANSSWELIPSFFRDIKQEYEDFNFDNIYKDLEEKKLTSKLETIFGDALMDYKKFAFLQHSLGYSPFLDFSKSAEVGLSFALSNMDNVTQFFHRKSCVYELDTANITSITNEAEASNLIKTLNITVLRGNPSLDKIINTKMWHDLINDKLDSKIFLIDIQTNDRMTYQKGVFLLFNNVLVIGSKMLLSFEKQVFLRDKLTKYIISEEIRPDIYKDFMNNSSQYQLRFLMNPYSHMQE